MATRSIAIVVSFLGGLSPFGATESDFYRATDCRVDVDDGFTSSLRARAVHQQEPISVLSCSSLCIQCRTCWVLGVCRWHRNSTLITAYKYVSSLKKRGQEAQAKQQEAQGRTRDFRSSKIALSSLKGLTVIFIVQSDAQIQTAEKWKTGTDIYL